MNNPRSQVLSQVSVGDVLPVTKQSNSAVVTYNGQLLGALTGGFITTLKACLDLNVSFEAEVVQIQGGSCSVEIRRV